MFLGILLLGIKGCHKALSGLSCKLKIHWTKGTIYYCLAICKSSVAKILSKCHVKLTIENTYYSLKHNVKWKLTEIGRLETS